MDRHYEECEVSLGVNGQIGEFVRRCDLLLAAAQNQQQVWMGEGQEYLVQATSNLIAVVQKLRGQALNGTLPPSKGMGWGMARAVGEWGDDTELHDLAFDLEQFYRHNL